MNPYTTVWNFERMLCDYTGAKYAVAVNSCTMALLLACAAHKHLLYGGGTISIPKRTYVSVPQSIIHAGYKVDFRDEEWSGAYQLEPLNIWDCARRFTSGMYVPNTMQCVSFHWSKILGVQQGGAILLDDPEVEQWLRRARFDGRREGVKPKDDNFDFIGWHCYMSPEVAAAGMMRMSFLPRTNADLPNDDYPDLSLFEVFRN